jgi:phospholipase/carboxylesterase
MGACNDEAGRPMSYFRNDTMDVLRTLVRGYLVLLLALPLCACASSTRDDVLHTDLAVPYLLHSPQHGIAGAPLIVLLHGMGSNERDLYSFRSSLPARYAVVSARAPYTISDGHYRLQSGCRHEL